MSYSLQNLPITTNLTPENNLVLDLDGYFYALNIKGMQNSVNLHDEYINKLFQTVVTQTNQIDTLNSLTRDQTNQIDALNFLTRDQTNQIDALNSLTRDQTNQIDTLNSLTRDQTSQIDALNSLTRDQTNQIDTLNSLTRDQTNQIDALNSLTHDQTNQLDTLNSLTQNFETRIKNLEDIVPKQETIILIDSRNPYIVAKNGCTYITDTDCTFATIRIPENQDTLFGFSFKVVDFGAGEFQVVQSDNQQILTLGQKSTVGSEGGLRAISRFGAVGIILAKKNVNGIDLYMIDGELPSNMVLF